MLNVSWTAFMRSKLLCRTGFHTRADAWQTHWTTHTYDYLRQRQALFNLRPSDLKMCRDVNPEQLPVQVVAGAHVWNVFPTASVLVSQPGIALNSIMGVMWGEQSGNWQSLFIIVACEHLRSASISQDVRGGRRLLSGSRSRIRALW